ncbi:MAG: hypothetical protein P8H03_02360 [Emcibacteraceae bacterium]|nr:hypothetical protein [Emcibacteraceae bacterium]
MEAFYSKTFNFLLGKQGIYEKLQHIKETFYQEHQQYILMVPILLAFGIGGYFTGTIQGSMKSYTVIASVLFIVAILIRNRFPFLKYILFTIFFIIAGYLLAGYRVHTLATATLEKELRPTNISGTVERVHLYEDGKIRLTLKDTVIRGTDPLTLVNVRVNKFDEMPYPGDKVELRAGLMPPPGPSIPVIMIMVAKYGSKD